MSTFATDHESGLGRPKRIVEGVLSLRPEPGTEITFEMISEWLGEPFPIESVREGGWVVPDTSAMFDAQRVLERQHRICLVAVENKGYRVPTAAEALDVAERRTKKAQRQATRAGLVARAAAAANGLSPAERERAEAIQRDSREARLLLLQQARLRSIRRRPT